MTIINNTVSQSFQETWHTQFLSMLKHFQEKLRSTESFRSLQLKCVSVKMTFIACFSTCCQNTVTPFFTPLIVFTVQCSFAKLRLSSWDNHTGHLKCEEKLMCIRFVYSKKTKQTSTTGFQLSESQVLLSPFRLMESIRLNFFPPCFSPSFFLSSCLYCTCSLYFLGYENWEYCFREKKILPLWFTWHENIIVQTIKEYVILCSICLSLRTTKENVKPVTNLPMLWHG